MYVLLRGYYSLESDSPFQVFANLIQIQNVKFWIRKEEPVAMVQFRGDSFFVRGAEDVQELQDRLKSEI